jgi:hypothetical protein
MSSPEVWDDASARVLAVAQALSPAVPVKLPNEDFERPNPANYWIDLDVIGQISTPLEISGGVWEETGQIWVKIMLPISRGLRDGLVIRKAISNAFRILKQHDPADPTSLPVGLVYRNGQILDPIGLPTDDGVYSPLALAINYIWQDIPT